MKNVYYFVLRLLVKSVGMLSDGIRMSFRYGFTSGKMLDYIYRGRPSGKLIVGKWLDRIYLSHKGWQLIRVRKTHLEQCLSRAIDETLKNSAAVSILDIASGPARYLFDTLSRYPAGKLDVLCRDFDRRWVDEGNAEAAARGIRGIRFECGDAFDEGAFAPLKGRTDIVVSSGFYDWIVDDSLVQKSIGIVAGLLKKGSFFVYTNQSGHVDLAMVSKVFVDFNKKPLVMKTRSADLFNGWVEKAGFTVLETLADPLCHYSVSRAVKI
jgi:SAM-dependent methyltransferase